MIKLPSFKTSSFYSMKTRSGFTLLELLMVVTIIAVISVIGLVTYTNVQKSTRDARRKADVVTIQKALEQYYQQNGGYPGSLTAINNTSYFPAGAYPKDPQASKGDYAYTPAPGGCADGACTSYSVCATNHFETTPAPTTTTGVYCFTNQQ